MKSKTGEERTPGTKDDEGIIKYQIIIRFFVVHFLPVCVLQFLFPLQQYVPRPDLPIQIYVLVCQEKTRKLLVVVR